MKPFVYEFPTQDSATYILPEHICGFKVNAQFPHNTEVITTFGRVNVLRSLDVVMQLMAKGPNFPPETP